MQLSCWSHLSFFQLWVIQAFLPVLYPLIIISITIVDYLLFVATMHEWTLPLLRLGWRPRRSFSFNSLSDSYLPMYILYLNAYYITGAAVRV